MAPEFEDADAVLVRSVEVPKRVGGGPDATGYFPISGDFEIGPMKLVTPILS